MRSQAMLVRSRDSRLTVNMAAELAMVFAHCDEFCDAVGKYKVRKKSSNICTNEMHEKSDFTRFYANVHFLTEDGKFHGKYYCHETIN